MNQAFLDLDGKPLGSLAGPWWLNNTTVAEEVEQAPEEAFFKLEFTAGDPLKFRLAASDFYQFWLNGHWMGCGPARASHGHLTVDEWDLPPLYQKAKNTLVLQIFWEGIFVFDHVRGTPGLWFSLENGGREIAAEVQVTEKTGRMASKKFSHQRGWIEQIDGRERIASWPNGPWVAGDWDQPILRTVDPVVVLEARDIKPFTQVPVHAESVSFVGSGDLTKRTKHRELYWGSNPGFEGDANLPSTVMQEELLEPARATDVNVSALAVGGRGVAVLGPDMRGLDRTLQLNFGRLVTGNLSLTLEAPAGTVVDFGFSEGRWNESDMGHWARSAQPGGSAPSEEFNDSRQGMRYICRGGGVETFHSLFLLAFQHLRIAFRSPETGATIRLHDCTLFSRGYPIVQEGTFTCSDAALNRLHAVTVYTLSCAVDDAYLDCPGRERGSYPNDSYWTSMGFLEMTGDVAFDRRYLRQFFDAQDDFGGIIPPIYPADSKRWLGWSGKFYAITGHILYWLLQCEKHLRLYGDAALKEEWKPNLARTLSAVAKYRSAEGLLESPPWDTFLDWSRFESGPIQTGDNFIYALTLTKLGEFYENPEWLAQGRETAETIERLAWAPDRELYADTVVRGDNTLTPSSSFSGTMNFLAVWTGLAEQGHAKRVWRQMRNFRPVTVSRTLFDYETDLTRAGLYGLLYRFDIQGRLGETPELIRDLREAYEPMLARGQGTLGEHLGYHGSLCHGFNGFVIHLLNRHVAGIELPEVRGGVIRFRPHPGVLDYCQARVCWMQGHVQVWWSCEGDEVEVMASVPLGQKGELIVGEGTAITFTDSLHTKVAWRGAPSPH